MSSPLDPAWAGRLPLPKAPDLWASWCTHPACLLGAPFPLSHALATAADEDGTLSQRLGLGWVRVEPEPVRPVLPEVKS